MVKVHLYGGMVYKPLFYEFPGDVGAYNNLTENVMLGSSIKISHQTSSTGEATSMFYFP